MKKEKKNRRSVTKNASLKKQYNTRIRQEYIDMDYLDKLDDTKKNCKLPDGTMVTQLEYMSFFMKEWNGGNVSKQSEAKKNKFHRTAKEVKSCTDRTNQRNRDQYGIAKARNLVHPVKHQDLITYIDKKETHTVNTVENALIELLDEREKLDKTSDNE